jgi:phospholipid/cholesterol/gamma-HCH transport system substrate-binding protein
MRKESNLEFKVGLFVFVAALFLTIFIFSITDSTVFEKGKSLKVIFNFANGLKENAPVRVAGVDQGVVKDINLFFDRSDTKTKVEVEIWIKKETKVPADSIIMINQLGLLGEKYIEVVPGVDTKQFLESGQLIVGKDPIPQELISERVMEVATKIDKTFAGVSQIINDAENQNSFNAALSNISSITGNVDDIIADMKSGRGTLGKFFYDDQLYENLEGLSAELKANPWKLLYRPTKR